MSRASFEKKIEKLQNEHDRKLDKLGEEVRQKYVIPACRRHKLTFGSGMGSYSFHSDELGLIQREDAIEHGLSLAVRAYEVLDLDVDSRGGLGVWVGDVNHGGL